MDDVKKNAAARALAKRGAAKGGRARAAVLTPEERSEIARHAVRARWEKAGKVYDDEPADGTEAEPVADEPAPLAKRDDLPHSLFNGTMKLGEIAVQCHVLNDGRRVITQREVVRIISPNARDSGNLTRYLDRNPVYPKDYLKDRVIRFRIPGTQYVANGFDASVLIDICEMYLEASDRDMLKPAQERIAKAASIVIRACAKVGIIALIDEATGYQKVREQNALQLKLQAFIADDMQEWARMFPTEFWYELARIEGVRYSPRSRPLRWGKYVMAFVYDAIDKDVGRELRRRNPNPHHRQNHHQWLRQYGREKVRDHINQVIGVMKTCIDMPDFRRHFNHVFKKEPLQLTFEDLELYASAGRQGSLSNQA